MNPYDWRINDIERTANEAKNRLHELDSVRGDVARLECSLRDSRAEVDELRSELERLREEVREMKGEQA